MIVVDDGSRDGTLSAALDLRGKNLFRVFHRRNASSPATARNFGATQATGELLFFLDADDVDLRKPSLRVLSAFEDPAVDWVKTGVALSHPSRRLARVHLSELGDQSGGEEAPS